MALQYLPKPPRVEFIIQKLIRVIVVFNAYDLTILIESQPLDLDLDVQDQFFSNFGQQLWSTELQIPSLFH